MNIKLIITKMTEIKEEIKIQDNCVYVGLDELVIAFIGLPSAGKSTLVNSITGKRLLKSGVCRTTLKPHVIGDKNIFNLPEENYNMENLESDDNIEYTVIDLPGLADSENKSTETNFDTLTLEWIKKADIIFWVSDIRSAFITRYEKEEFEKIEKYLKDERCKTGKYYQLAIMLSKYDCDDDNNTTIISTDIIKGELVDETEDTTTKDCYDRVIRLFSPEKYKIIKFNAFGRIDNNPKSSSNLKQFYKKYFGSSSNINTDFTLKWSLHNYNEKAQNCLLSSIINYYFYNFDDKNLDTYSKDSIDNFNKIINKLNDEKLLRQLLDFLLIDSDNKVSEQSLPLVYDKNIWNKFIEIYMKPSKIFEKIINTINYKEISLEQYKRLCDIVDNNITNMCRIYLHLVSNNFNLCPPKNLSVLSYTTPLIIQIDIDFAKNRLLSTKKDFIKKIETERTKLWGKNNNIDICMVIMNTWHGSLPSLFSYIE